MLSVYLAEPDITIPSASGNRDSVTIRGQGYGVGGEGLMVAAPRLTIADQPGLADGSRAIGAGDASPVDVDIDGEPRAGRWDVGADQHPATSVPGDDGGGSCQT